MANTYTELYYHFIWATRNREPYLTAEVEPLAFRSVQSKCTELKVAVYALNGLEDHVHLVCGLPATLSVAKFLNEVKGASSHLVNHVPGAEAQLYWQEGYGALTFARRDLARIVAYVQRQKEHHADQTLWASLERIDP